MQALGLSTQAAPVCSLSVQKAAGITGSPGSTPCIKKMGKLRHIAGRDCPKSLGELVRQLVKFPGLFSPQCWEVGNEGVHMGIKSGIGLAKPVESTGMK